jgi:regulator of replication initiation timing
VEELEEDNAQLKRKLAGVERKVKYMREKNLQIGDLQARNEELEKENDQLKLKLSGSVDGKPKNTHGMKRKIEEIQARRKELEEENRQLKEKLSVRGVMVTPVVKRQIQELWALKDKFDADIRTFRLEKRDICQLKKENGHLKQENGQLQEENIQLGEILVARMMDHPEMKKKLENLQAREEEFLKQIEILHLEETSIRELKEENGYLKEKLVGVERKVEATQEIKRNIEELQERIEELKKVHHHISQLKKENSELQVENDQLKDDNRIFRFKRTEIRQLQKENGRLIKHARHYNEE